MAPVTVMAQMLHPPVVRTAVGTLTRWRACASLEARWRACAAWRGSATSSRSPCRAMDSAAWTARCVGQVNDFTKQAHLIVVSVTVTYVVS